MPPDRIKRKKTEREKIKNGKMRERERNGKGNKREENRLGPSLSENPRYATSLKGAVERPRWK